MDNNWVSVFSSVELHNVELLRHMLAEQDIEAVIVNKKDSFYPSIGEIELFVRRDTVIAARKIIDGSGL